MDGTVKDQYEDSISGFTVKNKLDP